MLSILYPNDTSYTLPSSLGLAMASPRFCSSLRTITGGARGRYGTTHCMLPSPGGVIERRQSYILYAAKVHVCSLSGVAMP